MPKRSASSAASSAGPPTGSAGSLTSLRQNLVEAPTFTPTAAEFENPLRYLLSIREEAERYGICCIQPPPSWKPPCVAPPIHRVRIMVRFSELGHSISLCGAGS